MSDSGVSDSCWENSGVSAIMVVAVVGEVMELR